MKVPDGFERVTDPLYETQLGDITYSPVQGKWVKCKPPFRQRAVGYLAIATPINRVIRRTRK